MIFLHRQNIINSNYDIVDIGGIEIDIRSCNEGLVLNHDRLEYNEYYPFLYDELKKLDKSKIVIANVKESGLEEEAIENFNKLKLNYYFLDSQIPDILKLSKKYPEISKRFIVRVSDVETYNEKFINLINPEYVWLDYTEFDTFDADKYFKFLDEQIELCGNRKIIIVSPELYSLDYDYAKLINTFLISKGTNINVCTKRPEMYKELNV